MPSGRGASCLALVLLLAAPAAWATPVQVVLPRTESEADWRVPLALAGLEPGGDLVVRFIASPQGWEILVVAPGGAERRATVKAPTDATSREDVAYLAGSLASELRAATRAVPPAPVVVPLQRPPTRTTTRRAATPTAATPSTQARQPDPVVPAPPVPPPTPPATVDTEPLPAPEVPPTPASVPTPDPAPTDVGVVAPASRLGQPAPWSLFLGVGAAARFTPGTQVAPAVSASVGLSAPGPGPFLAISGAAAGRTEVSTGEDTEQMFASEVGGVIGFHGGTAVAPSGGAEFLVAYRSYQSDELRIAKLLVPVIGAQAGVDAELPLRLTLRVSLHARYDLWSVHVHEPPAEELVLSPLGFMLTTGLIYRMSDQR